MIVALLNRIAAAKPAGFPEIAVGSAPAAALPFVTLSPGDLATGNVASDVSSEPRPREWREDIAVTKGARTYPLAKSPLPGTLQCFTVTGDQAQRLIETDDYSVDYKTSSLILTAAGGAKSDAAATLRPVYSFAGIFAIQQFRQAFSAEISAATPLEAEQWSSILLAVVLLNHADFIDGFNAAAVGYQAGDYTSSHLLESLSLTGSTAGVTNTAAWVRLTFQTTGQLILAREKADFGLIRQIVSSGRTSSTKTVDIGL